MTRREVPAMDQHDIPNNAYEATVPQNGCLMLKLNQVLGCMI